MIFGIYKPIRFSYSRFTCGLQFCDMLFSDGSLILQMHGHHSEHWFVVNGTAKVVNDNAEHIVNINESTFIPAGHIQRLENPDVLDFVVIEIQCGEYLG